jgi:AcrR family transcriptional regulator
MAEAQRRKILEAMAEVLAENGSGPEGVDISEVTARAGVSSEAFTRLFLDVEDCVLGAFELGVERLGDEMSGAYSSEVRWLDAIRAALARFLWFLEAQPELGRLLVVHSTSAGPRVLRRRMEVLDSLARIVDRGREESAGGLPGAPAVMAEGVVGAVLTVVHNRLLADGQQAPIELFGPLVSIVVLPYLGANVARRELTRPAPRIRRGGDSELPQSLDGQVGPRLTYRTARVLISIDDFPGASNREVAERAGVIDQGQISKLLGRLEGRGLIEEVGEGRTRGAPNSWRLTGRGEELVKGDGLRAAMRSND